MKKAVFGFTLIELMVVVSIIGILSTILYANFNEGYKQSRDAERQAALRNVQSALELYKNRWGRYPEGCNGPGVWSGQVGTSYVCNKNSGIYASYVGKNQYIIGHQDGADFRKFSDFLVILPKDPKLNGVNSGYVYTVDADGMVYKIMAMDTVESEVVGYTHAFSRCGDVSNGDNECASVPASPVGLGAYNAGGSTPGQCNTPSIYNNDYAIKGGYANGGIWGGSYTSTERAQEYFSDIIRCK